MKTLALKDGDLVVGPTGHATITGSQKIATELNLALGELYGNDRFHPNWGSTLPAHVGAPITGTTQALVKAEVNRVLNAYIQVQFSEVVSTAQTPGVRSRFSTADVVSAVNSVTTTVSFDTIFVQIILTTLAGTTVTLNKAVSL